MKNLIRIAYVGILASAIILTAAPFPQPQKPTARQQVVTTLNAMIRITPTDDDSRTAQRLCRQLNDFVYDMSMSSPKKVELAKMHLAQLNALNLSGDLAAKRTTLNAQIKVILPN